MNRCRIRHPVSGLAALLAVGGLLCLSAYPSAAAGTSLEDGQCRNVVHYLSDSTYDDTYALAEVDDNKAPAVCRLFIANYYYEHDRIREARGEIEKAKKWLVRRDPSYTRALFLKLVLLDGEKASAAELQELKNLDRTLGNKATQATKQARETAEREQLKEAQQAWQRVRCEGVAQITAFNLAGYKLGTIGKPLKEEITRLESEVKESQKKAEQIQEDKAGWDQDHSQAIVQQLGELRQGCSGENPDPVFVKHRRYLDFKEKLAVAKDPGKSIEERQKAAEEAKKIADAGYPEKTDFDKIAEALQRYKGIASAYEKFGKENSSGPEALAEEVLKLKAESMESPYSELVTLAEQYQECKKDKKNANDVDICISLGTPGNEADPNGILAPWTDKITELRRIAGGEITQFSRQQADELKAALLHNKENYNRLSTMLKDYDTEKLPSFVKLLNTIRDFPGETRAATELQERLQEINGIVTKLHEISKEIERWYSGNGTSDSLDNAETLTQQLNHDHGFKTERFRDVKEWMVCAQKIPPAGDKRVSEMNTCLDVSAATPSPVRQEEVPPAQGQQAAAEAPTSQQAALPTGDTAPPAEALQLNTPPTDPSSTDATPVPTKGGGHFDETPLSPQLLEQPNKSAQTAFSRLLESYPELQEGKEKVKGKLTPYRWMDFLNDHESYPYLGVAWSVWEGGKSPANFDKEDEKTVAGEVAKLRDAISAKPRDAEKVKILVNDEFVIASRKLRQQETASSTQKNPPSTRMLFTRYFSILLWRLERKEHELALDSVARAYLELSLDDPTNALLKALGKAIAQDGGLAEQWDGERVKLKQPQSQ